MLSSGRIDNIPLGVDIIEDYFEESKAYHRNIAIEKGILIYFDFPFIFYVSNKSPILGERIQLGLERIIASGLLNETFNRYYQKNFKNLSLESRRTIYLKNPYLMKNMPFDRKELWMISSYDKGTNNLVKSQAISHSSINTTQRFK